MAAVLNTEESVIAEVCAEVQRDRRLRDRQLQLSGTDRDQRSEGSGRREASRREAEGARRAARDPAGR